MIKSDIHTHTLHGHGENTVREMFEAGQKYGLLTHGFSEHSPRPNGYDYPVEYREKLALAWPAYLSEVKTLADEQTKNGITVLLGVEMDWLEDEPGFMSQVLSDGNFEYAIGGIHFLGNWGFDYQTADWSGFNPEDLDSMYTRYYQTMRRMAESKLFNVVAHPDLIKIFSKPAFDVWLTSQKNLALIREALLAARDNGMAMEVSSAGLRKPCREIYPGPRIMRLAAEINMPITFASDGHCVNTIAASFDYLEAYAKSYGWQEYLVFRNGDVLHFTF